MVSHTEITKEKLYKLEKNYVSHCLHICKHTLLAVSLRSLALGMGWGVHTGRGCTMSLTQR